MALTSAALAALGQAWSTAAQRQREQELAFRGQAIANAIQTYVQTAPAGAPAYPTRWEDLLQDKRGPMPRHHLRRVYVDPFTGEPDWELLPPPNGASGVAFAGVRSRSDRPLLRVQSNDGKPLRAAQDWAFMARLSGPAAPASAP